ncbi:hypothetical protein Tco_0481566 [Tanacetum coccineum]|uniref:Uncharacterized protein n=1 Tax=Tanacetum coccineum TaxID=301880 RepID=A0ABQ5EHV6_9ASTR
MTDTRFLFKYTGIGGSTLPEITPTPNNWHGSGMIQMLMMQISNPFMTKKPMAEVQLTAECNIFAIGQQHTEQPEIILSRV